MTGVRRLRHQSVCTTEPLDRCCLFCMRPVPSTPAHVVSLVIALCDKGVTQYLSTQHGSSSVWETEWPSEPFISYGEFEEKITLAHMLEAQLPPHFLRVSPMLGPARAFLLWFPCVVCSVHKQPPCARPEGSRSPGLWDRRDSHAGLPRGFSRARGAQLSGSGGVGATYSGWTRPHALSGVPG